MFAAIILAGSAPLSRAGVYFFVDFPALQSGYTVSGSITTDGTIGSLAPGNITDYSLQFTGPTPGTLTPSNTNINQMVNVTATASDLSAGAFELRGNITFTEGQYLFSPDANQYRSAVQVFRWSSAAPATPVFAVAAAVPEASEAALLAIGGLGLFGFRRRSRSSLASR